MEIRYDMLLPSEDAFIVTVLNKAGVVARREHYSRDDIEGTFHALTVEHAELANRAEREALSPADRQRLDELNARISAAVALYPRIASAEAE